MLLLVVLVFCSFTLRPRNSRIMSAFAIAVLGSTMVWMVHDDPKRYAFGDEFVHFVLASSMLIAVTFLTGQFDYLRNRLEAEKADLKKALARINLLATTDELTGLPNRRFMNDVIAFEEASVNRGRLPMCMVLIDVDRFKTVNDRYGHNAGDNVLRTFAAWLKLQLRDGDVLARWGGEEFLLMLSAVDEKAAERMISQVQQQACDIDLKESGDTLKVTFSAGIAAASSGVPLLEAVSRADKAMFHAKNGGRNTYRIYDIEIEARRVA